MSTRRHFIAGAGAALLAAPHAACAQQQQQQRLPRLAWVHALLTVEQMKAATAEQVKATGGDAATIVYHAELRRLGWTEGVNLMIEYWSGVGRGDADDFIRQVYASKPDLAFIPGASLYAPQIVREAGSVPTIFTARDPIALGLVKNLARPGGAITGFSIDAGIELIGKLLQLIVEGVPGTRRVAYYGPRYAWESAGKILLDAAAQLGVTIETFLFEVPMDEAEMRRVFAVMAAARPDAVLIGISNETFTRYQMITEQALAARLPAIAGDRPSWSAGLLMAYGPALDVLRRRTIGYIDRILRGAKPGDLPVQQPEDFEFIVNLKTAKALGITIPDHILVFATEIIE